MIFKNKDLIQVTLIFPHGTVILIHIDMFPGDGDVPITCCGENVQNRYNL